MSSNIDSVAVSSDVGTWVAAFFAIVALVGVIAPWLALQAAFSDRNRALNAIRDVPQKYVTRGLRVSRRYYLMRRIHVPDLSPIYVSNDPSLPVLISPPVASNIWTLSSTRYGDWNTGWAKLCELIQAYDVRDVTNGSEIPLDIPSGGNLEIMDGLTALVVSKYWILLVGLLGRYGKREDRGILKKSSIRRDMDGERASIRQWLDDESASEASVEGRSPVSHIRSSNTSLDNRGQMNVNAYRAQHGNWKLTNVPLPKLYGITGDFQYLGRLKGSWRHFTSISFDPHAMSEIMVPGIASKKEVSPLCTLFWLAYGFLPHPYKSNIIISLEDPPDALQQRRGRRRKSRRYFRLLEANYMPSSIGKAIHQLSLDVVKVMQFLEVPADSNEDESPENEPGIDHEDNNSHVYSDDESTNISLNSDWVIFESPIAPTGTSICLFKSDVESMITALLYLSWDPWGYLVWRRNCDIWKGLLHRAMNILNDDKLSIPDILRIFEVETDIDGIEWNASSGLDALETERLVHLETKLSDFLSRPAMKPFRTPLATLFILDASFEKFVRDAPWDRENAPFLPLEHTDDGAPSTATARPQDQAHVLENSTKIEFDFSTKELRFHGTDQERRTWNIELNMVNPPGYTEVVDIPPEEITLIAIWAGMRAFLWVNALDSRPLLEFVKDLDRHVHVL
ncbi:hypothetical protein M434DRAFT_402551 [Hypoxylon sp. CO27-5]|nr:hypothetical protein M434DRAFT_402551 [Hypoxylon sp. CO27-5]